MATTTPERPTVFAVTMQMAAVALIAIGLYPAGPTWTALGCAGWIAAQAAVKTIRGRLAQRVHRQDRLVQTS